jgi:predicted peptidase
MPATRPNNKGIAFLVLAAVAAGVAGFMFLTPAKKTPYGSLPASGKTVVVPMTDAPMQEHTRYFKRYSLDVTTPQYTRSYTYFWREPAVQAQPGQKFPLVMFMHGSTGGSYGAKYLIAPPMNTEYPAFVFVPVLEEGNLWALKPEGTQNLPDKMGDNRALPDMVRIIQRLAALYPVDTDRIYAIGCSLGGIGAYGAARYFPDVFAAAVPISGEWNPLDAPGMTKIPMLIMHGARDTLLPASNSAEMAEMIKSYGGRVYYAEFPSMSHNCPAPELYSDKVWAWLFSKKRGAP